VDIPWKDLLSLPYVIGILIALLIEEIFLGFFRWLWRKVMSLLSRKPPIVITPVSALYYRKNYLTKMEDGVEYVVSRTGLLTPKSFATFENLIPKSSIHEKHNNEFVFVKVDIQNLTDKTIEIDDCRIIVHPRDRKVEILPARFEHMFDDKIHYLMNDLRDPVTLDNLFALPIILQPATNYYRYLCLQIIDFPDVIDNIEIDIVLMEGKDDYEKAYKGKVAFTKNENQILLKKVGKFWKKSEFVDIPKR